MNVQRDFKWVVATLDLTSCNLLGLEPFGTLSLRRTRHGLHRQTGKNVAIEKVVILYDENFGGLLSY